MEESLERSLELLTKVRNASKDVIKVVPMLSKQLQFLYSKKREVLYSGGYGSGKSRTLCYKAVMNATNPGSNVLLVRKTLTSLKGSTLKTLLERDGDLDPVLPLGSYSHNKSEGRIDLRGGGTITYGGCDNAEKFRSTNFGVILIDEASQLDEDEYSELLYRLRNNVGEYQQIAMATNPGNPYHFLYKRFFECSDGDKRDRQVIKASSLDNHFLKAHSPHYIKDLLKMTGARRERFVFGEWVAADKMIYDDWDRSKNIRHRDISEFRSYVIGVDYGFTHPCGIVLIGVDNDGNTHLIEEYKKSKLFPHDVIQRVHRYDKLRPVVICDPAAPLIAAELQNSGLTALKAINDVESGISELRDRIVRRMFTCEPSCIEFIQEVESYAYDDNSKTKDGKDVPVKKNDDLVDPVRYVHMYLADKTFSKGAYIYPTIDLDREEEEEEEEVTKIMDFNLYGEQQMGDF